ncbi:unnamed protein product, partial [Urochloa humidicola]
LSNTLASYRCERRPEAIQRSPVDSPPPLPLAPSPASEDDGGWSNRRRMCTYLNLRLRRATMWMREELRHPWRFPRLRWWRPNQSFLHGAFSSGAMGILAIYGAFDFSWAGEVMAISHLSKPERSTAIEHIVDVLLKTAFPKIDSVAGEEVGTRMWTPAAGGEEDREVL